MLDQAMVLRFKAPSSFTGEDVVEIHCHGGIAVIDAILDAVHQIDIQSSIRPAARGEFTRRAYAAGKLGLTQVEGLADLLLASTQIQRRQAVSILSGALERRYDSWRNQLTSLRAAAEASVDFADDIEGDVDFYQILEPTLTKAKALRNDILASLEKGNIGMAVRNGIHIVLAGPPNAGKSSLLNKIAQRPAAIVTDTAGTTRDILQLDLTLAGFPVSLYDTAGLRTKTNDPIEEEGIRRAHDALLHAHLICYILDASCMHHEHPFHILHQENKNTELIFIANKCDLLPNDNPNLILQRGRAYIQDTFPSSPFFQNATWISTIATEQDGIDHLLTFLESYVQRRFSHSSNEPPAIVRQRHQRHVLACLDHLNQAIRDFPYAPELGAEGLRLAAFELGRVVGIIDVEDVLDSLFSTFCIGK
uniref:TrmE-type G domain-containing protein n=1 Tax=Aureoumbra lagunensis TaxID=44058 RepID=A0A7S3NIF7_9STRA|mmetsp:Transcript_342/g.485  ORF Transcript_342/g.485 Transcript_342/m.485 type:complete len:420 (-) Transcript_342:9-1268(-)